MSTGVTNSPAMNLPIPGVGITLGPDYALAINIALTLIDQHDHSPGKGVAITPAGLNINSLLSFNGNPLEAVSLVSFSGTVNPTTSPSSVMQSLSIGTASSINELYYTDSNGTQIQITKNGQVNVVASSIPGESYVAGTFIWDQTQSGLPTTPANFAIGSVTLSPNIANAYPAIGLTLNPPSAIASAYSIDFPLLPASTSFMAISNSGVISTPAPIAGTAGQYLGTNGTIPVWTSFPAAASVPTQQVFTSGSGTYTRPAAARSIIIRMVGGGGGGGSNGVTSSVNGGSGGGSSFSTFTAGGGGGGKTGGGTIATSAGGSPGSNSGITGIGVLGSYGQPGPWSNSTTATLTGGSGGSSALGGAGMGGIFNTTLAPTAGEANTGGGGGGAGSGNLTLYGSGGGGASGNYVEQTISSPATTYSYSVGAGGTAGTASGSQSGGAGGSGIIIVDEYY